MTTPLGVNLMNLVRSIPKASSTKTQISRLRINRLQSLKLHFTHQGKSIIKFKDLVMNFLEEKEASVYRKIKT